LEELLLLSPGGQSAAELAAQLLVDRRTIYRDIDFLSVQGVSLIMVWGFKTLAMATCGGVGNSPMGIQRSPIRLGGVDSSFLSCRALRKW
jgi:hypothetical protein